MDIPFEIGFAHLTVLIMQRVVAFAYDTGVASSSSVLVVGIRDIILNPTQVALEKQLFDTTQTCPVISEKSIV